jgi:hypothetical protein
VVVVVVVVVVMLLVMLVILVRASLPVEPVFVLDARPSPPSP